jgi:hypothetical protein
MMSGQADIAVATEALDGIPELVTFPYYRCHHAVIVPEGHSLLRCRSEYDAPRRPTRDFLARICLPLHPALRVLTFGS